MRVLVAASGTGGHLFPARHIINSLLQRGVEVEFVGAGRPLEGEIIGAVEIARHVLSTAGIKNRGLKGIIQFLVTLPRGVWQTYSLFRRFKPDVVVGVGGYVTFLPITVAFLMRIPRWIHEAEQKPGLANSVLSLYSTRVSLAFPGTRMFRNNNTVFTGHPVRSGLEAIGQVQRERVEPNRLLVLGGSQGARALDLAMIELCGFVKTHGLSVWHQCREENRAELEAMYRQHDISARVMPFIHELPEAYAWCDIIVSRAGAGAVSEIAMIGRPAVLVPYPYAQGDHQTANAQVLVEQGKATIVQEGPGFSDRLRDAIFPLLDVNTYNSFIARKADAGPVNAADEIADGVVELAS